MISDLHIIAFDVPYPPDYGGVIDIYYKVKALSDAGVNVHLHCYEYRRPADKELQKICASVRYYERKLNIGKAISKKPYIVASRNSPQLLDNLAKDNFPILFEGLHTTALLNAAQLKNRYKIVRTHNVEHEYYAGLADAESDRVRKIYFRLEAGRLKAFEKILKHANLIATISKNDYRYFRESFSRVIHLPPFHPYTEVTSLTGKGDYILFHGNLSVPENSETCLFLIEKVFSRLQFPVVIAGKSPSTEITGAAGAHRHIRIIADPGLEEMEKIISDAHINVLFTFQATGLKLKLLSALFGSRHCVANSLITKNTGLENLCIKADTPESILSAVNNLMPLPFDMTEIESRKQALDRTYSNKVNAKNLLLTIEKRQS